MNGLIAAKIVGAEIFNSVKDRFKTTVVERWSKYRAEQFFESFIRTLAYYDLKLADEASVKKQLDILFDDEIRTEVLFDAYRKVAFAASKTIGPRIIGILVGRLVHHGRHANQGEEKILMAAELLNDSDFESFEIFFKNVLKSEREWPPKYYVRRLDDKGYELELESSRFDSGWNYGQEGLMTPIDLDEKFGTWALKIQSVGLLKGSVHESETHERVSEIDFVSTHVKRERKFLVTLPAECFDLFKLACEAKNILATE